MVRMGFDSATSTSQELVEFCERLGFTEELSNGHEKPEAKPKPGPSGGKTGRSYAQPKSSRYEATPKNPNKNSNYKRQKVDTVAQHQGSYDPDKYCNLHGKYGHDLKNCKVMLEQVKQMRSAWQTTSTGAGQNDRIYKKKGQEKDLHALVQKMVQGAMQQQQHHKKRKAGSVHFADESTAKMPSKESGEDNDEDYDTDIDDFGSLNLKTPQDNDTDSDGDLYA
jgi:hypothetical protein